MPPRLASTDVASFVERGFVVLRGVVPAEVVDRLAAVFWRRMAGRGRLPWPDPLYQLQEAISGPDCRAAYTRELLDAVTELVDHAPDFTGLDADLSNDWLGWFLATFPGHDLPPATPPALGWHVDGGYEIGDAVPELPDEPRLRFRSRRHRPTDCRLRRTPDRLVLNVMITDSPAGTGTALVPGSHHRVRALLEAAEPRGLTPSEVQQLLTDPAAEDHGRLGALEAQLVALSRGKRFRGQLFGAIRADDRQDVIQVSGARGDVLVLHPWLLHATSRNVGAEARIVCNPWVDLRSSLIEQDTN